MFSGCQAVIFAPIRVHWRFRRSGMLRVAHPRSRKRSRPRTDAIIAFAVAVAAALAIKVPALFGIPIGIPMANENEGFYVRNASLLVLPFLTSDRRLQRFEIIQRRTTHVPASRSCKPRLGWATA